MSSLLSRHAESVFWMARYFERAESLARILETQTSFQRGRDDNSWAWIVALYSDEAAFTKAFEEPSAENVIRYYMAYIDNPGSIQSSIRAARENARALRPMLSTDMWYQLNDFYNRLGRFSASASIWSARTRPAGCSMSVSRSSRLGWPKTRAASTSPSGQFCCAQRRPTIPTGASFRATLTRRRLPAF
jgi:uncharacterized alpha-E superfamily protein